MNQTTYLIEERCSNGGKIHWHFVYETDQLRDARRAVLDAKPSRCRIRKRTVRERIVK